MSGRVTRSQTRTQNMNKSVVSSVKTKISSTKSDKLQDLLDEPNIRTIIASKLSYLDYLKTINKKEVIKATKNLIKDINYGDIKVILLKGPSTIFFNSILDMIAENTIVYSELNRNLTLVEALINNTEEFNINMNKDGQTILMTAIISLVDCIKTNSFIQYVPRLIKFIKTIITKYPQINSTITYTFQYMFKKKYITCTATPFSFLLYAFNYYKIVADNDNNIDIIRNINSLIYSMLTHFKFPDYYISGIKCPGPCYGIIGDTVIDNIWIVRNLDAFTIKKYIKNGLNLEHGYDKKNS